MVYSLWPYNNSGELRDFLPEPLASKEVRYKVDTMDRFH